MKNTPLPLPLKDKWIVITRPKHQANQLRLKLEAAGANIILFPLLEIVRPDNIAVAQQQLAQIEQYELAIFTSANAVNYSLKWLNKNSLKSLKVAAIGKKTASLLKDNGIHVDHFPSQYFNSEALLAMPEIQSYKKNHSAVIIRGQNGRGFLKQELEKQGVKVDYIDVYKRIFPQQDISLLSQQYHKNQLDMILITSASSLQSLFKFLPDNEWLNNTRLLVGSERIKALILVRYPDYQGDLLTTPDPSDETLYQQLLKWGKYYSGIQESPSCNKPCS